MIFPRPHLRQDLEELVLRLPWWISLLCAFASYLLLHPLTVLRAPAPSGMLNTAVIAIGQLLVGIAGIAQYLIPIAFLALTAVSASLTWKRYDLRSSLETNPGGMGLRGLSHEEIALLVTTAYRSQGYQVRKPDNRLFRGGLDLELIRGGDRQLVHLRNWKSSTLGVGPLREVYALMLQTRIDSLSVLISGRFSSEAKSFAADKPIELIDGRGLKSLILVQERNRLRNGLTSLVIAIRQRIAEWYNAFPRTKRRDIPPRLHTENALGDEDDAESALGNALDALIRDESQPSATPADSPGTAIPETPPPLPKAITAPAAKAPRIRIRTSVSIPHVANALGMALSLGLIWMTYQWFDTLPAAPADTPWSLLGRGQEQEIGDRSAQTGEPASSEKTFPPLGQLDYGPKLVPTPSPGTGPTDAWQTGNGQVAVTVAPEPLEVFHSIRELEDAFMARYVPPPVCYDRGLPGSLAHCGNHRIRARRAFIASNGRTMVPSEPQPPQQPNPPSEPDSMPSIDDRSLSWRAQPDWRQPSQQDLSAGEPEPTYDWRAEPTEAPEPIPDWRFPSQAAQTERMPDRYRDWWPPQHSPSYRESPQEPNWQTPRTSDPADQEPQPLQHWRAEQAPDAWSRREQPGLQPPPMPHRGSAEPLTPSWRQDRDAPPRVQRQPVEDWLPRNPVPARPWRHEQSRREQGYRQDPGDWRQDAEAPRDLSRPHVQDDQEGPQPDWRQDWLRQR